MTPLDQDKLAVSLTLEDLITQVKEAAMQLSTKQQEIEAAKNELRRVRDCQAQLVLSEENRIAELQARIGVLERERMQSESDLFDLKTGIANAESLHTERMAKKSQDYTQLVEKIAKLEKDKWNFEANTRIAEKECQKAQKKLEDLQGYQDELRLITKEIALKQAILAKVEQDAAKIQQREDDINRFAEQLAEKERSVNERERIVGILETRITPKYKKIFKQFSNI